MTADERRTQYTEVMPSIVDEMDTLNAQAEEGYRETDQVLAWVAFLVAIILASLYW